MDLNTRELRILEMIFYSEVPIHVDEISDSLNISKRSVQYDIKNINYFLEKQKIAEIQSIYGEGYSFDSEQKREISDFVKKSNLTTHYYQFLPYERINIIMAYLTGKTKFSTLEELEELVNVSKNTIVSDLKLVKEVLKEFNIELVFTKNSGYHLTSDPVQSRSLFLYYFNEVRYLYKKDLVSFLNKKDIEDNLIILKQVEKELNTKYVEGVLESLAALLTVAPNTSITEEHFSDINLDQIKQKQEYLLVDKYLLGCPEFEKIYISLHLLGGRVQLTSDVINLEHEERKLFDLCRYMVFDFESIACVKFDDSNEVAETLFIHLRSSIYRYRYGIDIGNPLVETIKSKYKYLYEITRLVSADITKFLGIPATENEIAYLTIIFGSKMEKSRVVRDTFEIYVVCFESIGIKEMLKNELEYIIESSEIIFLDNLDQDILLSIHQIDTELDYILINPILTNSDKTNIMNRIFNFSMKSNHSMLMESVFDMVSGYIDQKDRSSVYGELETLFENYAMVDYSTEQQSPSLLDVLFKQHIRVYEETYVWNEAIKASAKPLLEEERITENYVNTILNIIIQKGPYMYFGNGVFIAHASPKDGVNKLSVSVSIFKNPVVFEGNLEVGIIINLAPIDYHKHLRIIKELLEIFEDEKNYKLFVEAESSKEVYRILEETLEKRE